MVGMQAADIQTSFLSHLTAWILILFGFLFFLQVPFQLESRWHVNAFKNMLSNSNNNIKRKILIDSVTLASLLI